MTKRLIIAMLLATLAACGNKGPLVMPQRAQPVEVQPAPQPETPVQDAETPATIPATTPASTATPTTQPVETATPPPSTP